MYNIHPTDFLIFSFDREAFQSKVLFQRPLLNHLWFLESAIPIYGYQFIPGTFKRIIDPETAPIVKLIFEMFIEGHGTKEIINRIIQKW